VIANHTSYLDHYVIGLTIMCQYKRRVRFLAKKEHFDSPLHRWIHEQLGAFPIDRDRGGKEGLKSVVQLLDRGEIVLIYPEGTRSPDGQLKSFKPGVLFTHFQSGCEIVPAGINGAYEVLPRDKKIPRPGRISLKFGPAISYVSDNDKTQIPRGKDRITILENLRNEVGRLAH
jgi:1-acyl-sn-glycerol-3-phosphate acyltransferase